MSDIRSKLRHEMQAEKNRLDELASRYSSPLPEELVTKLATELYKKVISGIEEKVKSKAFGNHQIKLGSPYSYEYCMTYFGSCNIERADLCEKTFWENSIFPTNNYIAESNGGLVYRNIEHVKQVLSQTAKMLKKDGLIAKWSIFQNSWEETPNIRLEAHLICDRHGNI